MWKRIATSIHDLILSFTAENLKVAVTFTGSDEESWFVVVHVLEETAAAPGLEPLITACNASLSRDNETLESCLMIIEETLPYRKWLLH